MTELEIYKEKYNDDNVVCIDKPTKELAEQWLDVKIDALEHINRIYRSQGYGLEWGEFDSDKGEFPNNIEICAFFSNIFKTVHIYNGIQKLAEILGKDLASETDSNGINYFFMYNGYKVFQIGEDKS